MLRVGVLGPIVAADGHGPVELGGPLPRRLLAALVAAQGRPVSNALLVELVWEGDPPARADASVQAYVSGLRKALGGRNVLPRSPAGYQCVLEPGAVDTERFAKDVDEGRRPLKAGDAGAALVALDQALGYWRGEPYAELAGSSWASAEAARLRELRAVAVEERLAAVLQSGDAAAAAAELEAAVEDAPYRERRWALLVLSLYRSGRQADALAALRRVRNLLVEDLGVDPGPELQNLERAVLAQDPGLLSSPSPEPVPVPVRRPSAMPRPLSSFVGRAFELLVLADTARQARLVTLVGTAGCGKTRLAVEYANGCADEDGPWLVRLADVQDPTLVPMAFVEPLGLASVAGAPLAAVTQAMTTQRGLLLVDNCEHVSAAAAESIRELLDACPDIRVLATSREPLGVDGERLLPLAPLEVSTDDGDGPAVALFIDRATQVRPGWSPDQAELELIRSICRELDGIPLALELAAAPARVLSVAELAALLHDRFAASSPYPGPR